MGGESDWLRGDELAIVIRTDAAFTVVAATPAIGIPVGHAIAEPELVAVLGHVVASKRAETMPVVTRDSRRFQPVNQPVIEGGEVRYVVHRLVDVTDLAVEREHAEAALDAFSFSVGHDLRFPLRVIDGYSSALAEDCVDQLDDQGKDYVKSIRSGVARMEAMIESLRELTRVGREPISRVDIDVTEMVRGLIGERGDRAVAIAEGLTVHADRRLLETALGQLIDNAWKFTSKTELAQISIGRTPDGALFVRDNGAGFDAARAERLFSPFRKLHAADYPGVGMGLAIAQRAIARHGGRIWVEATLGQGATFYFVV